MQDYRCLNITRQLHLCFIRISKYFLAISLINCLLWSKPPSPSSQLWVNNKIGLSTITLRNNNATSRFIISSTTGSELGKSCVHNLRFLAVLTLVCLGYKQQDWYNISFWDESDEKNSDTKTGSKTWKKVKPQLTCSANENCLLVHEWVQYLCNLQSVSSDHWNWLFE